MTVPYPRRPALAGLVAILTFLACSDQSPPPAVAKVIITPDPLNLHSGDTATLAVKLLDAGGSELTGRTVAWTSLNTSIARVTDKGKVRAVSFPDTFPRATQVFATSESVADTVTVFVTAASIATIEVSPDTPYVTIGGTVQLKAKLFDKADHELSAREVTWSSSDPTIAQVSTTGLAIGIKAGKVILSATSETISGSQDLTVGNLGVTIGLPHANRLVGDNVGVRARVTTVFQLASVTATLGTSTVPMTFDEDELFWFGSLPIGNQPFGEQQLRVTATDVFGNARTAQIPVIHDPPPVITLVAPTLGAVATPSLTLTATCSDRNAVACQSITAKVNSSSGATLATGIGSLNTDASFAGYEGQRVTLLVIGTDSAGQTTTFTRDVLVLSATGLQRVLDVPGLVLDYDGARTLYTVRTGFPGEFQDTLRIRAAGGGDTKVPDVAGLPVDDSKAFLMPSGAIFVTPSAGANPFVLHEFRDGSTNTLSTGYISTLAVKGTFALWLTDDPGNQAPLNLRDLVTQQTTIVANDAANNEYDVTPAGDVAYWTSAYQVVYVAHGGAPVTLTIGPQWNVYPRTDGTRVVYLKENPCCNSQTHRVYMAPVSGGEIELSTPSSVFQSPDRDYMVQGGWVAYTQKSATTSDLQVWSRSPLDVTTQVSFFGTSSRIEALDANGTIVLASGTNRYMSSPPYSTLTPIGSALGNVRVRNGQFVILVGGAVFVVP